MKFYFNLKGRRPTDTRYTFVRSLVTDTQWELYKTLLTGFLFPSLQPGDKGVSFRQQVKNNDPEFIAWLAIYLREEADFKDLAFLLTAELAVQRGDDRKAGALIARIVQHAGEIPAWLEFYGQAAGYGSSPWWQWRSNSTPKPSRTIRKSLSALLNHLDEYQARRYDKKTQTRLKDAFRLLRPVAEGERQKKLFGKILRGQLPVRITWEQEWTALHQQHYDTTEQRQVALRDKWKEGISSFRIGYTALLDNLNPMLCAGVSGKVLKLAAEYLGNATAVSNSGTSPLPLLEAYRALRKGGQDGAAMLSEALEQAILHSSWIHSGFGHGSVSVIAMDVSDSMRRPVPGYGYVERFDIGPLLAFSLKSRGEKVITGFVGNTWKPLNGPFLPVLGSVDQLRLREGEAGYAINAHLVVQDLLKKRQVVDKVLIFTDSRLWDHRSFNQPAGIDLHQVWKSYRQLAPHAKLYLFDLAGSGPHTLESHAENVFLVAGWFERIFDLLQALEKGENILKTVQGIG